MSALDKHNELAREFVLKVAGQTRNHSELMVVVESMILATMLLSQRRDGLSAAGSVEMIEMAVQQATDRFTAMQEPPPPPQ